MSTAQVVEVRRGEQAMSTPPTWWIVFKRELADLWIGGKAPALLLVYSILLGILTYVLASNGDLSLMNPREMVYQTLRSTLEVGLFIGLILGADSISGERERGTLESLLLTPTSRRQLLAGKFLAALTPWPAAMAITVPFFNALAQGNDVLLPAVFWGFVLGSVLTIAWTGMGMFVSFWCNSNRTSFAATLGIFLLFYVPTQLPQREGSVAQFLQWVNPSSATTLFVQRLLVNNRTLEEFWTYLIPPVVFALLTVSLVFLYAAPGLRLVGGRASKIGPGWRRIVQRSGSAGVGILVAAYLAGTSISPAMAHGAAQATSPTSLQIAIDMNAKVQRQGEYIEFKTTLANKGTQPAPPLILAMNIINVDEHGDVVDPEDWSPKRTQYQSDLTPGQSATHSWRVNSILNGDYVVYIVVMPAPASPETTSQPITSAGIHLTITPYTKLDPYGILIYSLGMPAFAALLWFFTNRVRRRQIDMGES